MNTTVIGPVGSEISVGVPRKSRHQADDHGTPKPGAGVTGGRHTESKRHRQSHHRRRQTTKGIA